MGIFCNSIHLGYQGILLLLIQSLDIIILKRAILFDYAPKIAKSYRFSCLICIFVNKLGINFEIYLFLSIIRYPLTFSHIKQSCSLFRILLQNSLEQSSRFFILNQLKINGSIYDEIFELKWRVCIFTRILPSQQKVNRDSKSPYIGLFTSKHRFFRRFWGFSFHLAR